jgi:FkbM family methyltransferase
MKKLAKKLLGLFGLEIVRKTDKGPANKSDTGRMDTLLYHLKSCGLKCQTILDVGANNCDWSRMAREIFPAATYHLIEPQEEMKIHLDTFCREFKNSSYSLAGAGAEKGTLTLTIWDDLLGSSLLPAENEQLKNTGKQRQVEIITIDDLISRKTIGIPTLIKLDIQGFELEALKGATLTFGETEAYILEVSLFPFNDTATPLIHDVINFMLSRNYVIYDFPGFLRRPYDGALGQCDICFVKADGFLRSSNRWS